ncbi:MAG: FecR domain-containing protein [Deltaproteobacteria bacterium]|nr:FecR domain-containing protein [Deltaproteobacteria bacterium]
MKVRTFIIMLVVFLLIPSAYAADSPAGYLKTVKGTACVIRQGETIPAVVGERIFKDDTLRTGPDGSLGITFMDDTVMSMGPGSEVSLNDFEFSPAEGRMSIFTHMLKGTVVYLSGIIAKLSPDTVRFETPVANISLRGTRFAVKVEGDSQDACK